MAPGSLVPRMMKFSRKMAWSIGLPLLLILLIGATYLLRQETYRLNKNVRLVWMRILTYRELSLHRDCAYRIQFSQKNYGVSVLHRGGQEEWQEHAVYSYVDGVEVAAPGFTIVFDAGDLVSYYVGEKTEKLKPSLILYFFHREKPEHRRGILFSQASGWRAL